MLVSIYKLDTHHHGVNVLHMPIGCFSRSSCLKPDFLELLKSISEKILLHFIKSGTFCGAELMKSVSLN